jgi:hypothetical protein
MVLVLILSYTQSMLQSNPPPWIFHTKGAISLAESTQEQKQQPEAPLRHRHTPK